MREHDLAKIIELRQVEAVKKNISKKALTIVSALGFSIMDQYGGGSHEGFSINQGSPLSYEPYEQDVYDYGQLPTQDTTPSEVGRYFDGLSSGANLQISQKYDILQINFEGRIVYREQAGQLERYAPSQQWEEKLDSIYVLAQKRVKLKESAASVDEDKSDSRLQKILDYMRDFWGFN